MLTGQFGNLLDAKAATSFANDDEDDESEDENAPEDSTLLKQKKAEEANLPRHSTTKPQVSCLAKSSRMTAN